MTALTEMTALRVLRRGGRLVAPSAPPPAGKADEYGVTATFFIVQPNRAQLTERPGKTVIVVRDRQDFRL
jgi:hypothetical protein